VLAAQGIGYNEFARGSSRESRREEIMAKDTGVYRVTEVIGTSTNSWEDAARNAVKTAAKSLRDLRIAEITKLDVRIENGKISQFRARLSLSFKYEA
jgi:flavin-binding protein dodecin